MKVNYYELFQSLAEFLFNKFYQINNIYLRNQKIPSPARSDFLVNLKN
jgi:hypothetical protein